MRILELIGRGADVNTKDIKDRDRTAMHIAVSNGRVKTTLLLIEQGADIDCRDIGWDLYRRLLKILYI